MLEHVEPKPKTVKIPGPDHPISVERNASRVVVTVAGRIVADTRKALTLREASLERRAATKNNENQSVCDRFSIVYLLYWNFLPRLGKLLNTRWNLSAKTFRKQSAPNRRAIEYRSGRYSPASFFHLTLRE